MGFRTVYGNDFSENGWRMVDEGSCQWITVPGTNPPVSLQIQKGQPLAILRAFAADFNAYVEPLRDADSACWTPTNSVGTSNHLSGSGCDLNWNSHPFHVRNTFGDKLPALRDLLDSFDGAVWWGGDWTNPIDEMHFQMGWPEGDPRYTAVINKLLGGTAPAGGDGLTAETLAQAMGSSMPLSRYAELYRGVRDCLIACECTTLNRIAMWMAQIGHESGGLRWMEEIADGSQYEGRTDLGNTQPGDGRKFKGRGPIQVTGRHNYAALSAWAFGQGLVPTVTFFTDEPEQLSSDTYGFIGVIWYWTVARDMNSYADRGDIVGATRAVNGGTNGLTDRTSRWNRCLAMGFDALSVSPTDDTGGFLMALTDAEQHEVLDLLRQESKYKRDSRSPLRRLGEHNVDTILGLQWNTDANVHVLVVEALAMLGHPPTLQLLAEVAGADPQQFPDRQEDRKLAQAILNKIQMASPATTTVVQQVNPVVPQQVSADPAILQPTVQPLNGSDSIQGQFAQLHDQLGSLTSALAQLSAAFLGKK